MDRSGHNATCGIVVRDGVLRRCPVPAHHVGGGTRIGVRQVAGANLSTDRSVFQAMGVAMLVAHDRATWGRRRPSGVTLLSGHQREI